MFPQIGRISPNFYSGIAETRGLTVTLKRGTGHWSYRRCATKYRHRKRWVLYVGKVCQPVLFRIFPHPPRRKTFSSGGRPRIHAFRQLLCQQPQPPGILLAVQPLLRVHGAASRARWNGRNCFVPRPCSPQSRGSRHHLPTQRNAPTKRHSCPQERRVALPRKTVRNLRS